MTDLIEIVEELDELMKPYLVCVCEEPVEGSPIKIRFTYGCKVCGGVIPLQWVLNNN